VGVLAVFLVSGIMHEALFWWEHSLPPLPPPLLLPLLPLLLLLLLLLRVRAWQQLS
jgi:hypothetical protein